MRRFYKAIYKLGLKRPYQKIDRLRYFNRLSRGGKSPFDDWAYANEDSYQHSEGEVLICSPFRDIRVLFYCNPRSLVERKIIRDGLYDHHILQYMEALHVPHSIVIDVGANIGAYAIPLAKAFGDIEIHAFEPNPFAVERLRRNLSMNGVKNVLLQQYAVGAQPGRMDLHAFGENDLGLSSLIPPSKEGSKNIPVEVITLDGFYGMKQRPISLIKIDVQGFELGVLQGGRSLIPKQKPYILLDHEDDLFRQPLQADEVKRNMRDLFSEWGYTVFYMAKFDPFMLFPVSWNRPLFGTLLAIPQVFNPGK